MKAKDLMKQPVVTVSANATVMAAARLMHECGHGMLPVIGEAGEVVGVVDRMTLLRITLPKYAEDIGDLAFLPADFKAFEMRIGELGRRAVREVMRPCDICASEDTPLVELAALMVLKCTDAVPVVREGRLTGIVGMQDIVDEIVWPHFRRDAGS